MKLPPGWHPNPPPRSHDIDAELNGHLDGRAGELMDGGLSETAARREAHRLFGDVAAVRAACADLRHPHHPHEQTERLMGSILQDTRFAARMLRRSPVFTVIAVLTIALGIGANTAIFSVVNGVLLQRLPYPDADRLVAIWMDNRIQGIPEDIHSYPNFLDLQSDNETLQSAAAYSQRGFTLTESGDPTRLPGVAVSSEFFSVFGATAHRGRTFSPADDEPGASPVVVLSHRLWVQRFGGEDVLGRSIVLNGEATTVVGVMPPAFRFPDAADLWTPLIPTGQLREERGVFWLAAVGRMQPGVTREQVAADLGGIMRRIESDFRSTDGQFGITINRLHDQLVGDVRLPLYMLLAVVGLVLLIACANVANLLLARGAARGGELAIRAALGAGRNRLVRQLVTESLLLVLIGGPLGVLVAYAGLDGLLALAPDGLPLADQIRIDGAVLAFTAALSVVAGLVFGLVPALHSARADLNTTVREEGAGRTTSGLLRRGFVVSEIALAMMLLVGAGLFMQSFARLQRVDTGFRAERLVVMSLSVSRRQDSGASITNFLTELRQRLVALPGVESATFGRRILVPGLANSTTFAIEGRPPFPPDEAIEVLLDPAGPAYFETLGIPLVAGRPFTESDAADAPPVIVINESMANRFWPGEDPVGKRMAWGRLTDSTTAWMTIVGVVGDVKRTSARTSARPATFLPFAQFAARGVTVFARTSVDPESLFPAIRQQVWALDGSQPITRIETMETRLADRLGQEAFNARLVSLFALVALLLAAAGVYGVMSYTVAQRSRELGVRMALGARAQDVMQLVLVQGLRLAGMGMAIGLVGALLVARLITSLLYGVGTADPSTIAGVAITLGLAATGACFIPAWRATRVNAVTALRAD